jgi:hypothetical protein
MSSTTAASATTTKAASVRPVPTPMAVAIITNSRNVRPRCEGAISADPHAGQTGSAASSSGSSISTRVGTRAVSTSPARIASTFCTRTFTRRSTASSTRLSMPAESSAPLARRASSPAG